MILADEDVVTSKRPIIKVFHNLLNQNFVSSLSSLENNQQTVVPIIMRLINNNTTRRLVNQHYYF